MKSKYMLSKNYFNVLHLLGNEYRIRIDIRLMYSMFMCNEQRSSKANLNAVLQLYLPAPKKALTVHLH